MVGQPHEDRGVGLDIPQCRLQPSRGLIGFQPQWIAAVQPLQGLGTIKRVGEGHAQGADGVSGAMV